MKWIGFKASDSRDGPSQEGDVSYEGGSMPGLWSSCRAREEHETCLGGSECIANGS